jgi:LysM repeat protein
LPEPSLPADPEVVAPIESMAPPVAAPTAVPDVQKPLEQTPSAQLPFELASPPMPAETPAITPITPIVPIPPITPILPSPPDWELPTAGTPVEAMSAVSPEAAQDHPTEAQPHEPPPDFDVWSGADEEASAADDAAESWLPGSPDPADGNAAPDLLAALNEWPAIQPLAPREQRASVAAPLPPAFESDAWPPAPSLTGGSAGAPTALAPPSPTVVRTVARPPSPPVVELQTGPVRSTLDAAALRRTRLPILIVLLAVALGAGFAAGPWLLSQLSSAGSPGPSDAGGVSASLQPTGAPSPVRPATSPSAAAPSASATAASSPAGSGRPTTYIVKRNDTLDSIAKAFGTTRARLMAVNHITDPNRIVVGQKLILPTN